MKLKICKKEAKESRFWLNLIDTNGEKMLETQKLVLLKESNELMLIFGAIIQKLK